MHHNTSKMNNEIIKKMIQPAAGKIDMILDTDTFNEIDDQFALTYAVLSPEKINLKACYAVPFFNENSNNPEHGMELSYDEINRVLNHINPMHNITVLKGSRGYLKDCSPQKSPAADDLIERSRSYGSEHPLYVVSIGALTNVMSAVIMEPDIINRIVVVWLGGNPYNHHSASEFNLNQDFIASKMLFDSAIPLVHIPCKNIAEKVSMSLTEMRIRAAGKGAIGNYLLSIFEQHIVKYELMTKPIWDITNVAYLVNQAFVTTEQTPRAHLKDDKSWYIADDAMLCAVAVDVDRDAIFNDFFTKLDNHAAASKTRACGEEILIKN